MKRFALTAVGRDKPGIVASVTGVLFQHGCNIEDSSMTRLQDEFAIILIMSPPDDADMGSIRNGFHRVEEKLGLTIHLKEIQADRGGEPARESNHLVTVSGFDKPGIVHKTADFLSEWGVNITDLETKVISGEDQDIYILLMEVFVQEGLETDVLEQSLVTLGESLGVRIETKKIEAYEDL